MQFYVPLMSAGVDTCDVLAGVVDYYPKEHLQYRFGFQIGHYLKLRRWRNDVGSSKHTSSYMPNLHDCLHSHGLGEFWDGLVACGIDDYDIFDSLSEQELYELGFQEGHFV